MLPIYSIIRSLGQMELVILLFGLCTTVGSLRNAFIRRLNDRQEHRATEYLLLINGFVSVSARGLADFGAIIVIFTLNTAALTDSPTPEGHCSRFSISDCQEYFRYTLLCLSFLAFLDGLLTLFSVGCISIRDIVSTLLGYCMPMPFIGLLYYFNTLPLEDVTILNICYRHDYSVVTSNGQAAWNLFIMRSLSLFVFFLLSCALAHATHSYLTKEAAEMIVSVFKDSQTEVDEGKSEDPESTAESDVTWIQKDFDKENTSTTGLFSDQDNIRMWKKYFLSRKAEMTVPSVFESLFRFSLVHARLYFGFFVYFACIMGCYQFTLNFFDNSESKYFTRLIFTTLLTINGLTRMLIATASENFKEEATHQEIYIKDAYKCTRGMYHILSRRVVLF